MDKNQLIEKILRTLEGSRFETWYANYIGDSTSASEGEIKKDIEKLFDLK